jgi:16S rRNA pseudouridine516 synthase
VSKKKAVGLYLDDVLFSQGFGTRRICAGLIEQGHVQVWQGDEPLEAPEPDSLCVVDDPQRALRLKVQGVEWRYMPQAYVMLHKPAGFECSQKPGAWPSVYTLLPGPLRQRPHKNGLGVQAVGRLDQDTTGLLLLTDDGHFIHRMSSPRHHVPKVYQIGCKHPVTLQMRDRLLEGVVLEDDPRPVRAAACEVTGETRLELTLTEGKYHQVKRMLAAVGNRVESLHRSRVGRLALPPDLAPGQWCWVSPADL